MALTRREGKMIDRNLAYYDDSWDWDDEEEIELELESEAFRLEQFEDLKCCYDT